jgi:hypothetical protein
MSTRMAIGFVEQPGVIEVKSRPARLGRNLADGEATQIKAGKKIVSKILSTPYKSLGCRASSARHPDH